jgi:hypothetical protein
LLSVTASTSASVLGWHSARAMGESLLPRRRPGRLREDMKSTGKAGLGWPAISSLERTAGIGVCLASGVKFEPVSYRRVLPFALPDVAERPA